eukprot:251954_1
MAVTDTERTLLTETLFDNSNDNGNDYEFTNQFVCGMRLRIDQLVHIDTANQRYELAAIFDKTWTATEKDISAYKNDPTNYKPQWIPKIDFKNCIDTGNIRYQAWTTENIFKIKDIELKDKITRNGNEDNKEQEHKYESYNCQRIKFTGNFTEEFEVENFPFDVQDLSIVIAPSSKPSCEFKFVPDMTHPDYIAIDKTWCSATDWNIVNVGARTTDIDLVKARTDGAKIGIDKDIYPYLVFRVQVQRKWKAVFFGIIIWMFLLGLLSFCVFGYAPSNLDGRLGFAITMVLTIVAFQFVIQSQLPKVSYLTLIDKYNFSIFGMVLLMSVESVIVGYHSEGIMEDNEVFDTVFCIVISCLFVIGHLVFSCYCWIKYKEEKKKIKTYQPLTVLMLARYRDGLEPDEPDEFRKLIRM